MKKLVLRLCIITLLLLAPIPAMASPDPQPDPEPVDERPPQPIYTADDCRCGRGSYEIETDRNSGFEGLLLCHYHKTEATVDTFENWKSINLVHRNSPEEALRDYQELIDDEFVDRYYTGRAGEEFLEVAVVERTEDSFFAYRVLHPDPDRTYHGDFGDHSGSVRPSSYYLERRFVIGTAFVTLFVYGEIFGSLGEAQAEINELEACVRDLIASRPVIPPEPVKVSDAILEGLITDVQENPIRYTSVEVNIGSDNWIGSTNDVGHYQINLGDVELAPDLKAELVVLLDYDYENRYVFVISDGMKDAKVTKHLTLATPNDLIQNIVLKDNPPASEYTVVPNPAHLSDLGVMHHHMAQVFEFYWHYLGWDIEYKLPVEVRAYTNQGAGTFYAPATSSIYIHWSDSDLGSPDRPMNREWHEFSHHAMYARYGRWPGAHPDVNHAGYSNPDTGDSLMEGFAELIPLMMAEYYGYANPEQYARHGNLELNYKAWHVEEFAVAGTLWDLMDEADEASDKIDLPADDVVGLLREYKIDFAAVYEEALRQFGGYQAEIDEVFRAHGFFVDNGPENRGWDEGETIGRAADSARSDRRNAIQLPGYYIKVEGGLPYYLVEVSFPDHPEYNYTARGQNKDGLVYVQVPPADYQAVITIRGEDVETGAPLSFTSEAFHAAYEQTQNQGYYLAHDFEISGEIPPGPIPPDGEPEPAAIPYWEDSEELIAMETESNPPEDLGQPAAPSDPQAPRLGTLLAGGAIMVVACLGLLVVGLVLFVLWRRGRK